MLPFLWRRCGHQETVVQQSQVPTEGFPAGREVAPHSLIAAVVTFPPFCFVGISRPAFGGRPCVGEDLQAKMCNTQVGWSPSWEADRS